jgi:hypothetical protein
MVRSIVVQASSSRRCHIPSPVGTKGSRPTAPIIFLIRKGQTLIPADRKLILDITPVDQVASVMLAVRRRRASKSRARFQAATGDSNANNMERIIGLCGLDKRSHFEEKERASSSSIRSPRAWNRGRSRFEFENTSVPMFNCDREESVVVAGSRAAALGRRRVGEVIDLVKDKVDAFEELTRETTEAFDMFRPFTSRTPTFSLRQRAFAVRSHQRR